MQNSKPILLVEYDLADARNKYIRLSSIRDRECNQNSSETLKQFLVWQRRLSLYNQPTLGERFGEGVKDILRYHGKLLSCF